MKIKLIILLIGIALAGCNNAPKLDSNKNTTSFVVNYYQRYKGNNETKSLPSIVKDTVIGENIVSVFGLIIKRHLIDSIVVSAPNDSLLYCDNFCYIIPSNKELIESSIHQIDIGKKEPLVRIYYIVKDGVIRVKAHYEVNSFIVLREYYTDNKLVKSVDYSYIQNLTFERLFK